LAAAESDATSLRITRDAATVSILDRQRPLLDYRFADVSFKPYVKTLHTPSGINILRDSPHDHVHHHALMFAVAADGVDFWAEYPNKKRGKQVHRSLETFTGNPDNVTEVGGLSGQVDWLTSEGTHLLRERRIVETYRAGDLGATLLTWRTHLEPAPGRAAATLSGSHYFGLGMRFVESMDRVGRFFHAAGKEGHVVRGTERLTRTKWVAYVAPAGGKTVTVAMFDHPENSRHPATMFTMVEHFAYVSATLNLKKEPLKLEAGKPLALRYGVAVWDGEVGAEEIERLYRRWVRLAGVETK